MSPLSSDDQQHDDDMIQVKEILIKGGANFSLAEQDEETNQSQELGERIQSGKTLLTLTDLISQDEIDFLVQSSLEAADSKTNEEHNGNIRFNQNLDNEGVKNRLLIRMPTVSACRRDDNLDDALPEPASLVLERIMERTLEYVDQKLCPSLKMTLFGRADATNEQTEKGEAQEEVSIADLFRNDGLVYSTREPAINVYKPPHGHFGMHKDGKAMTILIPLSDPTNEFEGGGTAFWSQAFPREGQHDASLRLRPKAGTVVLFGGGVYHSGLHIQSGIRVVFVASFSPCHDPPAEQ